MYGVIIGDIAGSRFESKHHKEIKKGFNLFGHHCQTTDDTVMSLAICKALLSCADDYHDLDVYTLLYMREFGKKYPHCGFGRGFKKWLSEDVPEPYMKPQGSYGNGAAMRVSGCGYAGNSLEEVKFLSKTVTQLSHIHPEAIKGAEAIAVAVFMARTEHSKEEIRDYICPDYYQLNFTLDHIPPIKEKFDSCEDTVPLAFMAFFESENFEDAIRKAVYMDRDTDTVAAMAGSIAEAFYGIPETLREQANTYLDDCLLDAVTQFEQKYPPKILTA